MTTVSEQRFLERVPNLLADISRSLESPKINWEQRRYEIAKDAACAMWLDDGQTQRAAAERGDLPFEYKNDAQIAREAVQLADALIAELRKPREER